MKISLNKIFYFPLLFVALPLLVDLSNFSFFYMLVILCVYILYLQRHLSL